MEYTLTVKCRNEKELQEVSALLSRKDVRGGAEDKAVDGGAGKAGDKAYEPKSDRTRRAYEALLKCKCAKLADAGEKLEAWALAYPDVDLAYWITKQDTWAFSNNKKWGTKGWARHFNWRLSKSQDEAKGSNSSAYGHNQPVIGANKAVVATDPAVDAWAKAAE